LNFRLAQSLVVDAHFVDEPGKVFSKDVVTPNPESSNGSNYAAGSGYMRHLNAIHIQRLTVHHVVGCGQMGPSIERNGRTGWSIQFI